MILRYFLVFHTLNNVRLNLYALLQIWVFENVAFNKDPLKTQVVEFQTYTHISLLFINKMVLFIIKILEVI